MGMIKEFKEFAMRGNVVDMAVGIIIGGAFGKIVTSMVNDIIMPPIGKAMGGVNFADKFINLGSGEYKSLADAQGGGAAVDRLRLVHQRGDRLHHRRVLYFPDDQGDEHDETPAGACACRTCPRRRRRNVRVASRQSRSRPLAARIARLM